MPIDDSALRVAARELLKAARAEFPIIAFAALACDEDRGNAVLARMRNAYLAERRGDAG